ncbi:ZINC FINGER MIZ DOMAIN-CONTAINING PROTEIN [Salix purpurea]|uniref:ZINC FINGER MIZ DOMAIN-CONTAINING PROTEIN n=1 Tax=Salix purpurea TaxID=77065 RepID=A0A9Q0SVT8_SALPP|nr:ZINC FINGER MIZ DOMAIN-CONTAINING PROTEIN [Salix purpurea]
MRHCVEDITEIEVKPDGSWRVKTKTESDCRDAGELAQWHNPDSTLCVSDTGELKSKVEMVKQIKQRCDSEGASLKLATRKNRNGFWEVSKPEDMNTSSGQLQENFEHHEHKVIPMSSSAAGSGCDGEDPSVNQDTGGNFEFTNNGMEHDSLSLNVYSTYGVTDQNSSAPVGNAEVIVLSDSDDENDILISSGSVYKSNQNGATFSVPCPEIADHFLEDPTLGTGGNSCTGLFNADDEYGMPLWPLPPGNQAGPGFQLFNSDVSDALVDISHEDPSLQIFLPTGPSDASMQTDGRGQADVSNGVRTDDWISLSVGGGATGNHGESVPSTNGLNSRQPMQSREDGMNSVAGTDSLLGISDGRSERASRQRSDSAFAKNVL